MVDKPLCTVGKNVNWCSHDRKQYGGSSKFENRNTIQSKNSTPGYLSGENENTNSKKGICTPMFIEALFAIGKIWNQPKCPSTDEWIKKWHTYKHTHTHTYIYIHTHIHTHNGILLNQENNKILPFVTTWMGLEGITLSEISQREKLKYCMFSLIWGV